MKKLSLLFIGVLSMGNVIAQDITDAVRYSSDEIQGTARFRAMSGAFGALGGDMSAVSLNPAGSAIFTTSHASISLSSLNTKNKVNYFNGLSSSTDSKFDLSQTGAAFVFNNTNPNSDWKKFVLSIAYDKVANFDDNWHATGVNTNSIDSYFYNYAQGLRLDEISGENYSDIGYYYGYANQQAFLGYESYILEPETDADDNTSYFSNMADGTFNQNYSYAATGYNGKFSFNAATQYGKNLYLGINLNSHFINYDRFTNLNETNNNDGSIVNEVRFQNTLSTIGTGFSFQLGAIAKLSEAFRVGLTYNSPIWYTISDETTQYLATVRNEGGSNISQVIDPFVVNVFPDYKLQTPGKLTGSLAYVFGDRGLISFDYSRKDYSNTKFKPTSDPYFASQNANINNILKAASTYRIGGEYRYKQFSFRGGYRLEESPYKDDKFYGDLNGYSLGLGYNFGNIKLDLAFDQSKRDYGYQLYNVGLTDAAKIDSKNSNVTLSLAFNL
ncbi:MAG: outer membrane protein transport protein [Gelidibacter sp.]